MTPFHVNKRDVRYVDYQWYAMLTGYRVVAIRSMIVVIVAAAAAAATATLAALAALEL